MVTIRDESMWFFTSNKTFKHIFFFVFKSSCTLWKKIWKYVFFCLRRGLTAISWPPCKLCFTCRADKNTFIVLINKWNVVTLIKRLNWHLLNRDCQCLLLIVVYILSLRTLILSWSKFFPSLPPVLMMFLTRCSSSDHQVSSVCFTFVHLPPSSTAAVQLYSSSSPIFIFFIVYLVHPSFILPCWPSFFLTLSFISCFYTFPLSFLLTFLLVRLGLKRENYGREGGPKRS